MAKTAGRTTLRMANAEVLPFEYTSFQSTVGGYVSELTALIDNMREATDVENQMIEEKRYVLAKDPGEKYIPPVKKEAVPYLNFSSLQNAIASLEIACTEFAKLQSANPMPDTNLNSLNKILRQTEQKLIISNGLPRRPWYKHSIYAPGLYTGYGVKTIAGVREAIEQRNWREAQEQIEVAAKTLEAYTGEVNAASKILMLR